MRRAILVAMLAVAGCSSSGNGLDADFFDGNVLVGDARPPADSGELRDAANDAGVLDAEPSDTIADGGVFDAEPEDAHPADAFDLDASPTCRQSPLLTLTASEAVARAVELDGMRVEVGGTVSSGPEGCTATICPGSNPCCNHCQAELLIDGQLLLTAGLCSGRVGCTGNECALTCSPPLLGFAERFRGILHAPVQATPAALELESVLP